MDRTPGRRPRWSALGIIWLLALAWLIAAAAAPDSTDWQPVEERWYVLEIGGAPAGWMSAVQEKSVDRLRLQTQMRFRISRGDVSIEMAMDQTVTETPEGQPVFFDSAMKLARQQVKTQVRFEADHMLVKTTEGGRDTVKREALPEGQWMPPIAAERCARAKRADGAKEFTIRVLGSDTLPRAMSVTSRWVKEDNVTIEGREQRVNVWKSSTDLLPGENTEMYLPDGTLVQDEVSYGAITVLRRLSSKAKAMAAAEGAGPELMMQLLVVPDRQIDRSWQARTATLRVKTKQGAMPALPSAGAQTVNATAGEASAILRIDMDGRQPASDQERDDKAYLEPAAMVDAGDELVMKLSAQALRGTADGDPMARAEALRRFVYRHISRKGFDTGFASASETARTRRGDCSEHAVLLCAVLRAQSIPARVATGLVYVDGISRGKGAFGWHMWTQALVDGVWIDLDATLPARYHALHVLTGVSSMADGFGAVEQAAVYQLIGNIEIDVLDVGYGSDEQTGQERAVPPAPLHRSR